MGEELYICVMKIAVNTRLLLKDRLEGIGWFSYETLKRITQQHPEHEFIFIFDRSYNEEFIFADNITPVVASPQARHPFLWYLWFERAVPKILKKYNADLFLSPDGFLSLATDVKSIAVIHDINFHHRPKDLPPITGNYYNHYFPKFAEKAERIATVSEYSKQDICKSYSINPEKVDVVYNGANPMYTPLKAEEKKATKEIYTDGKDYFLFVGALHPRKNVGNLLKAFDEYKKSSSSDVKLVIVGDVMFKTKELKDVHAKMQHNGDVIFQGWLSPKELHHLLGSALALTFVPYFEGFGIPIVEAMYCDTPVITSNVTSMPEVCGDAALLVDPYSVDSIKEGMLKMAGDFNLRNSLIAKGKLQKQKFSWDITADNLWHCIEKCF